MAQDGAERWCGGEADGGRRPRRRNARPTEPARAQRPNHRRGGATRGRRRGQSQQRNARQPAPRQRGRAARTGGRGKPQQKGERSGEEADGADRGRRGAGRRRSEATEPRHTEGGHGHAPRRDRRRARAGGARRQRGRGEEFGKLNNYSKYCILCTCVLDFWKFTAVLQTPQGKDLQNRIRKTESRSGT